MGKHLARSPYDAEERPRGRRYAKLFGNAANVEVLLSVPEGPDMYVQITELEGLVTDAG